jgi:hypothetical protein
MIYSSLFKNNSKVPWHQKLDTRVNNDQGPLADRELVGEKKWSKNFLVSFCTFWLFLIRSVSSSSPHAPCCTSLTPSKTGPSVSCVELNEKAVS